MGKSENRMRIRNDGPNSTKFVTQNERRKTQNAKCKNKTHPVNLPCTSFTVATTRAKGELVAMFEPEKHDE